VIATHVYGRFRYAVAMEDAAGNLAQHSAAMAERVINSDPLPPADLRPIAQDVESGQMTFRFTPSDRLAG
jgi:hypothetical protein